MSIEVGNVVEGVVTGITNFGAFVELPEGKTGLIHISEVADVYVKDVHDFLSERDKVKVKVLSVDERGKIGLSIKQLQEKKPEMPAVREIPPSAHSARTVDRGISANQIASTILRHPLRISSRSSSKTAMNG